MPEVPGFAEVDFLSPEPAPVPPEGAGAYLPGGRNTAADRYMHSEGYPPFPDRAKFIGTLTGGWYAMGRQFGERSGDGARCVSDIWWREQCGLWGKAETLKAMALYEDQIRAFDPNLIDFTQGIADGASPWLNQSRYADRRDPLYGTDYQRVLDASIQDEWTMHHPLQFPDGSSTYGGSQKAPVETCVTMCSGFSARGQATAQGEVIAAQNRHCGYDPRCYEQVFVVRPEEGNACWVLTNCPQVAANQVVNEKGVSIALFSGGHTNPRSLDYGGESFCAEGFGVPWHYLFLYAGIHADTAEQAIEMLTVGTPAYRDRTGRRTLLRGGGWIFMVTDRETMAVVEVTADRYAVRYAGEHTGPDWTDRDFVVATNHYLCDFSYDRDNRLTDVPMSIFRDEYERDPETGEVTGLNPSGIRFWTLMWDMKHHRARVDRYRAQEIMSGLYAYDRETGKKVECAQDEAGDWRIWGRLRPCKAGGRVTLEGGSADGKVAVLDRAESGVYWTMGSPCHWAGAWDAYRFEAMPGP